MMSSSNPVGITIHGEADDAEFAENGHLTSLYLLVAMVFGMMETLGSWWTDYLSPSVFGKEAAMLPHRSTLGFIITSLIAFAEIKSQGQTGFPFQTHPRATMISVNSLLIYGLASAAEHVFSAAPGVADPPSTAAAAPGVVDPPSIYAIVSRLGRIASLCILAGSLAFMFHF